MTQTSTAQVPARHIADGDVLVTYLGDGRPSRRTVVEVDAHSNVHGMLIIRTTIGNGWRPTGSTIVDPDTLLTVDR